MAMAYEVDENEAQTIFNNIITREGKSGAVITVTEFHKLTWHRQLRVWSIIKESLLTHIWNWFETNGLIGLLDNFA